MVARTVAIKIPVRSLIWRYSQPTAGLSGSRTKRLTDRIMPTSHKEDRPAWAKQMGNTMYSIESPIKQAAVINEMTMTCREARPFSAICHPFPSCPGRFFREPGLVTES